MSYSLTINDVEQNLSGGSISLRTLSSSWTRPRSLELIEHVPHHEASFFVEDAVTLSVGGTIRFRGRIKEVALEGVPGREHALYTCLGLRELSKDVCVRDPDHGIPRVVFNAPEYDDDYAADLSGKTVGEIIQWLFDNHADDLRAAGVIPAEPATGYVQSELDALAVIPPKITLNSMDFDAALVALMAFQPGHRFAIDPGTQIAHFVELSGLAATTITYNSADRPLSAILRPSTRGRATAVEIHGPMQPVNATAYLSEDGLAPLWAGGDEADWTWPKCFYPDNAETYGLVYRRFQIADEDQRRMARTLAEPASIGGYPASLSPQVFRKTGDAWAMVPASFDFENGILLLAQPATVGDEYADGAASCADDIALVYAYLAEPLTARWPANGFEGTAYSQPENPVQIVRHIYDESFLLPSQAEQYEDIARELLKDTQDIAYAGCVRLGTLDFSLINLSHRVNFAGRDDDGNSVATGFESLGAYIERVTCDFLAGRTELHLSTDPPDPPAPPQIHDRLAEAETLVLRARRFHSAQAALPLPVARAGNDGEFGADVTIRGVYSIQRAGDDAADRLSGHIDLDAGPGIAITRQADSTHNGFRFAVSGSGNWYWFRRRMSFSDYGMCYDMQTLNDYDPFSCYPVPAGRITRVIGYTPQHLSAGELHVQPFRKYRGPGAACPEERSDLDTPCAVISPASNTGYAADDPGTSLNEQDVLGLRVTTTANFAIAGDTYVDLLAGAYFEMD